MRASDVAISRFIVGLVVAATGCGEEGPGSVSCGPGTVLEETSCVESSDWTSVSSCASSGTGGAGGGASSSGTGGAGGAPVCEAGTQQTCYEGAVGTLDVGACHGGTQTCVGGAWEPCFGAVLPLLEICDKVDNDCDGAVDEDLGTLTCGAGQCAATTPACVDGTPQTCTPGTPSFEICDGIDNNCNGSVDENAPGANQACNTGLSGACSLGMTACVAGVVVCNQTAAPTGETCNGLDDNCNGLVDDAVFSPGTFCSTGKLGVCASGNPTCENGAVVCNQKTFASAETCNNLDDNCNGMVDEGNLGGNQACTTTMPNLCAAGTISCVSGSLVCKANNTPVTELCNNLDDDCDGVVDDNPSGSNYVCSTGQLGLCAEGRTNCVNGAFICNQTTAASPEICNKLDDDCDGTIDDGNPESGQPCTTSQIGLCNAGTTKCANGAVVCQSNYTPAAELCNGIDDDCDGVIDEQAVGASLSCSTGQLGPCASGSMKCTNLQLVCTPNVLPATEACDGLDNDCDGTIDEGCPAPCDPVGLVPGMLTIAATGTIAPLSSAFAPLCGGEVLVGHTLLNRIERYNVVTKTLVATYALSAQPRDIVYDASTNSAWITLVSKSEILKLHLDSGGINAIAVPSEASRLALGNGGLVFASHLDYKVSIIDGPTATLLATKMPGSTGNLIAYDKSSDQVFFGNTGGTSLSRHAFDPATLTLTPVELVAGAQSNCRNLSTSPAGGHVAYACGPGNGSSYSYAIFDYSSYDLTVTSGSWFTNSYPYDGAFSADGAKFLGSNTQQMRLFDVKTHALLKTWTPFSLNCSNSNAGKVAFSPGGTIAYTMALLCDSPGTSELQWFIP